MLKGAATIRLEMPAHMENSLIFHYNLKFYGDDKDNYEGISLKRFVMQVRSTVKIYLIDNCFEWQTKFCAYLTDVPGSCFSP